MNLNFLKSAFDKIGEQSKQLDRIAEASELTAASVTVGGVLFTKMDEMVKLLRVIANNGAASGKEAIKDAKALAIVGNSMEPLGKGFQILVQALNELPDGKEAAKKMDALVGGLVKLGEIGDAIVSFAISMIIATPLLVVSALLAPIWVPGLMFTLNGLMFAAEGLDKKTLKNISLLGNVGLSILALAGSLALVSLIGMQAIEGALYAGLILIGITKVLQIMSTMLDPKAAQKQADALLKLSMGIAVLGGVLALISLIGPQMLKGAFFAAGSILILGGVLALIDVLIPLEKVSEFNKSIAALGLGLLAVAAGLYVFTVLGAQLMKGALIFVGTMAILAIGLSLIGGLDTDDDFGKKMLNLGLGILAIGVSLALISFIGPYMLKGAFYTAGALLIIGGTFWLLDQMKILDKIEMGAKAMLKTAISILALGVALALFNIIAPPPEDILQIGAVIAGTAVAFGIIGIFGDTILKGAKAMGFVALSILALGLSLYFFDMLVPGDILSWDTLKAFVVVGALGAGFYLAGKGASTIAQGAVAMAIAGISLIIIGAGVYVLNAALPKENTWERIGQMGALIGGLGVAMALAGASGGLIALGALQMIVAGISLIVIAGGVAALDAALPKKDTWERIGQMGALIGGLAVAMAAAGAASPLILLGSAAMLVAGVAVLVIAGGVAILSALPAKKLFSKGGIFGDSGQTGFFGGVKSNFEVMMDAIADGVSVNPITAAGMLLGSAAFITAGVALLSIGKGIAEFQKVAEKADLKNLNTNVNLIVSSLAETFGTIGTLYPGGAAGLFSGGSVVAQGIDATMGMGRALTGIARGMQAMANLQFPTKFDKEGNPIEFESMDSDAPARVAANAGMITSVLATVFGEIGTRYPGGGSSLLSALTGNTSGQSVVAMGISAVSGMGKALTGIAKGVQAMANLKFPTGFDKDGNPTGYETIDIGTVVPGLIKNTQLLVAGLSSVFAEVGASEAAKGSSWFSSSTYEKGINVVKEMGTPLYNLANGVQSMANLKFPTGYDKDGNPTGYKSIGNVDGLVKKLAKNTKALIIGLAGVFEEVGKSGVGQDGGWFSSSNFEKGVEIAMQLGEPYTTLSSVVDDVVKITSKITDAQDVKEKVTAIISSITDVGGQDAGIINAKNSLIETIGSTYAKLGWAIPQIINAIATFTVDKAKSFASIFGGESPAELFESKTKFLKGLTASYLRMAVAIPLIVGSINTVSAEQLDEFTAVYGGRMDVDTEVLNSRTKLFLAVGSGYEKMGKGAQAISGAINGTNIETLGVFKGMFVGRVSIMRPVAGYEAQTELWNAIGSNMTATGSAFPTISSAINSMDLAKLTEARTMFEALAVLSKGGSPSDVLAQMGESLEDALDNLAEMLENFRSTVQEGNEQNVGMIERVGNTVSKVFGGGGGDAGQSKATQQQAPPEVDVSSIVAAIEDLESTLTARGIRVTST